MDQRLVEDYNAGWTQILPTDNIKIPFGNQPEIALWNLYQLANAIHWLTMQNLETILEKFSIDYERNIW
jgi:uncharacterized protein YdiU (UPF0061 family)